MEGFLLTIALVLFVIAVVIAIARRDLLLWAVFTAAGFACWVGVEIHQRAH